MGTVIHAIEHRLVEIITVLKIVQPGEVSEREARLANHPDCFGVPPRIENHTVEPYLDRADEQAARRAFDLGYPQQRR